MGLIRTTGSMGYGGTIVTTSGGVLYVFMSDGTNLYVSKSSNSGSSWSDVSTVSFVNTANGTGASNCWVRAAIDGNNKVHVSSVSGAAATRDVAYCLFDTSNDTWGTWEQAANFNNYGTADGNIVVDSNNKPHILYGDYKSAMGGDWPALFYVNKTGASWSSPLQISTAEAVVYCNSAIGIRNSNYLEVIYYKGSTGDFCKRTYTGTWSAQTVIFNSSQESAFWPDRQTSILTKSDGTVYRLSNAPALGTSTIYEEATSVGYSGYSASAFYDPTTGTRYIFYNTSASPAIYYIKNSGSGWSSPVSIGFSLNTFYVEWHYTFLNQTDMVWFIGFNPSDSKPYFYAYDLGKSKTLTPAAASVKVSTFAPSIPLWITAATFKLAKVDPTPSIATPSPRVRIGYARVIKQAGNQIVMPGASTFGTSTVLGGISWGYWITPTAGSAKVKAQFAQPRVEISWFEFQKLLNVPPIEPSPADFGLVAIDPLVVLSSLTINLSTPSSYRLMTVDPSVYSSLISLFPDPAAFRMETVNPSVVLSSISVEVDPATFRAITVDPSVILSGVLIDLSTTPSTLAFLTVDPSVQIGTGGVYFGVLRRWSGSEWVAEPVKVYLSGSWQTKPVKVFLDSEWKEVDVRG